MHIAHSQVIQSIMCMNQFEQVNEVKDVKKEVKAEESDDGYAGANTTASSCDYSMSQFKDDPLGDLPPEEESEEDTPLVCILMILLFPQVSSKLLRS